MIQFIATSECAIEHNGRFLLIERPAGKFGEGLLAFPGGKFEIEDAQEGKDALKENIKREVLEEVGLTLLDPITYVTSSYFVDTKIDKHVIDVIFHCRLDKTNVEVIVAPDEVPKYHWLTQEELLATDNCPEWIAGYVTAVRGMA